MAPALYLDTSAVLRAVLEGGTIPDVERRVRAAPILITSRLSLVESARALLRLQQQARLREERLLEAERAIDVIWGRCELWELTASVCDLAQRVAPRRPLRSLDALHLATYVIARRKIGDLELVSADERLLAAAVSAV